MDNESLWIRDIMPEGKRMYTVLDEKVIKTPEIIELEYPNCKYLLVNYDDIQNPKGNLYSVSFSLESFRQICEAADEFSSRGIPCILAGSYNNGGAFGVQYEIKE